MSELRSIARDTAQPAMKGAAIIAAAGGLVATLAQPAAAEAPKAVAAPAAATAVVGPKTATIGETDALVTVGLTAQLPTKAAAPARAAKPVVIKDVIAEQAAAKAAADKKAAAVKAAAAKAAADKKAATERASRTATRTSLTAKTYTRKATTNTTTTRATSGTRSSRNWATAGQCTWGALNMWYKSEGYYPGGWTGNALVWGSGARRAGYTVSTTPRARSIVVLQPGVHGSSRSAGHVGWVTAVNGNQVTMVEMNALAGAYRYNTRTVTHTSGMQYIYAP